MALGGTVRARLGVVLGGAGLGGGGGWGKRHGIFFV